MKHLARLAMVAGTGITIWLLLPAGTAAAGTSVAYSNDFDGNEQHLAGVSGEFSGVTTTESVRAFAGLGTGPNVFGGDFLRNLTGGNPTGTPGQASTLTLTNLPPHDSIDLNFLLAIIDTWDGNEQSEPTTPDLLYVFVDGVQILNHAFSGYSQDVNLHPSRPTYLPPAGVELFWGGEIAFLNHIPPYTNDAAYDMGLDPRFDAIAHTDSSVTIDWYAGGAGWDGGASETWGIDNIEVVLNGTADPIPAIPAGALLALVFGLVGAGLYASRSDRVGRGRTEG